MNYKLAKQLKDAGFPKDMFAVEDQGGLGHMLNMPTLEELIEACGEGGVILNTCYTPMHASSLDKCAQGATPIEAVAKLWLALHKKP